MEYGIFPLDRAIIIHCRTRTLQSTIRLCAFSTGGGYVCSIERRARFANMKSEVFSFDFYYIFTILPVLF